MMVVGATLFKEEITGIRGIPFDFRVPFVPIPFSVSKNCPEGSSPSTLRSTKSDAALLHNTI
jgi:hypothetical protein